MSLQTSSATTPLTRVTAAVMRGGCARLWESEPLDLYAENSPARVDVLARHVKKLKKYEKTEGKPPKEYDAVVRVHLLEIIRELGALAPISATQPQHFQHRKNNRHLREMFGDAPIDLAQLAAALDAPVAPYVAQKNKGDVGRVLAKTGSYWAEHATYKPVVDKLQAAIHGMRQCVLHGDWLAQQPADQGKLAQTGMMARFAQAYREDCASGSPALTQFPTLSTYAQEVGAVGVRKGEVEEVQERIIKAYKKDRAALREQGNADALNATSAMLGVLYEMRWAKAAEEVYEAIVRFERPLMTVPPSLVRAL